MAHKDYSSGNPIQIKVYDYKLSLWNTGHIPEKWSVEKFLTIHSSSPVNPDITNTFFRVGMIESWGRGIYKIINECEKAKVPLPTYEFYWGWIEVHLTSVKTLTLMRRNPENTTPALTKVTVVSIRSVERAIEKLKKKIKLNELERIKGTIGEYYRLISQVAANIAPRVNSSKSIHFLPF